MGAEVTISANPYTYNFLKGLTHSALEVPATAKLFYGSTWPCLYKALYVQG